MTNQIPTAGSHRPDWTRYLWVLLAVFVAAQLYGIMARPQALDLSYSEFKSRLKAGSVESVVIDGNEISGELVAETDGKEKKTQDSKKTAKEAAAAQKDRSFHTVIPAFGDPELLTLLEEQEVRIDAKPQGRHWLVTLLAALLPWVLIFGIFYYFSQRMQKRMQMGKGGGVFGFGKSKAKLHTRSISELSFKDVAGMKNVKRELQEMVEYLRDPSRFQSLGGKLPKGVLLVGPPGTGKTLMARAVAGEAQVPFYSISGSEFIEMFVGVGASRVRDMFEKAKKESPAIIFIDEMDSIGRVRGTGLGGGHDEREQTLNQILSEMDGFSPTESVVVMAATNRPDVLDPALVRPGRFDRRIQVDLPQKSARKKILALHTQDVPLEEDVDLEAVAGLTVGFSGADLKNLANEAALLAARKEKKQVGQEDFQQGRDKIMMGIEREDRLDGEEKKVIAYHEAGHALVAKLLPDADPLQKVTIIPRGRSLGATEQIPEEDRHNLGRKYLLNRIRIMLGGRAAEKLVFNELTTGAGDDLKKVTQTVRRMVCQWGMSEKLGPVTFQLGKSHPFLGQEMTEPRDFSEETAKLIDEEVRRIIVEAEEKAEQMLSESRDRLDRLAEALLEHETLSNEEINDLLGRISNT